MTFLSGRQAALIAVAAFLVAAFAMLIVVRGETGATAPGPPTTRPNGTPTSTQPEPKDPEQVDRPGTVGSGSLDDLIEERVGPFTLDRASRDSEIIASTRANDGIATIYRSPGATVTHVLLAYGSAPDAEQALSGYVNSVLADDKYEAQGGTLTKKGKEVGEVVTLTLQAEEQIVVWTHGPLMAIAIAEPPYAYSFLESVGY